MCLMLLLVSSEPNLELYLVMAAFEISAESGVAGGGPWTTTLVAATALPIVNISFPVITLS